MAKYLDLSLHLISQQTRCDEGFAIRLRRHVERIALLILISFFSVPLEVRADPWLDRVERSLRRIESASKYTEPAGAGSKLATKTHRDCIHKSDKDACARLIWRSPDLLPVRDWAVGTAHIKRGEMREQGGDVAGALEDYRDALGYHQFTNLNARIKRLEKRQKRDLRSAATTHAAEDEKQARDTQVKNALDETTQPSSDTQAPQAQEFAGDKQRHPIVVVAGWAATVADKDDLQSVDVKSGNSGPVSEDRSVSLAETTKNSVTSNIQSKPDTGPTQVATIATPPAPVRVVRARQPENSNLAAARLIPGRQALQSSIAVQDEARRAAGTKKQGRVGEGTNSEQRELSLSATQSKPETLQFNVNEEVARSLARVRNKTNEVLTTSALPDRLRKQRNARQRSFMSLAVIAMLTLMLFSSVAVAMGWRPTLPTVFPRVQRKPVLSVDDLEHLIKKRTVETSSAELPAERRRHPKIGPVARTLRPYGASSAAAPVKKANVAKPKADVQAKAADLSTKAVDLELGDGAAAQRLEQIVSSGAGKSDENAASVSSPDPAAAKTHGKGVHGAIDFDINTLDSSLLRRVSYSAASLIVVGNAPAQTCADEIFAKVDVARRSDLSERHIRWDASQARALGVLNPFALRGASTDDPLDVRQRFNAAFEFHSSIFECIFGERFVYDQKVMLRYLVMLLQAMPNSSLSTLYKILESPRSLEPLHNALVEIDNVSARLFFTTVFSSEEFSEKADYMRARLAPVVEHELVAHLCCGTPTTDPIGELSADGRWILLALDPDVLLPVHRTVLVRSLLSVLALHSLGKTTTNTGEIISSVFLSNAPEQIGGSPTDAEFLLDQVKRAGYNVL